MRSQSVKYIYKNETNSISTKTNSNISSCKNNNNKKIIDKSKYNLANNSNELYCEAYYYNKKGKSILHNERNTKKNNKKDKKFKFYVPNHQIQEDLFNKILGSKK